MGQAIQGFGQIAMAQPTWDAEFRASEAEYKDSELAANVGGRHARVTGNQEAGQLRTQGSQLVAQQRVAYANSGVDASTGTAADVQADTAAMAERDAQTAQNNAAREAWGFSQVKKRAGANRDTKHQNEEMKFWNTFITGVGNVVGGAASSGGGGGGE